MKALLIQHKDAGTGAASAKALAKAIARRDWKVDLLERDEADAKAIAKARPDLIVVAGGDGTVADIARRVPDRSVPLAIIPTGTANDIARSFGIAGDVDRIVEGWDLDRRLRFDVGNVDGPWGCRRFVEGVGLGVFADSLRRAPESDGADKLRAGRRALAEALDEAAPLPITVRLDRVELPGPLLMVEAMIVPFSGPRLMLAPAAAPGDGLLQLSWLTECRRKAMRDWLDAGGRGQAPVETRAARVVRIRGGAAALRIDDESCLLEPGSELTIGIEAEPLQILAPARILALAG